MPNFAPRVLTLSVSFVVISLLVIGLKLGLATVANAADDSATQLQQFNIPAGNLANSLNALARQAGLTLSVDPEFIPNKTVPALSGNYSVEQALRNLLVDSGMTFQFIDKNTITLKEISVTAASKRMQPITVTSQLQERSLQNTHASVAVITGEELDRSTDKDINDVLNNVANVAYLNQFSISIRGIQANSPTGAGNGLTLNVNVDGTSFESNRSFNNGAISTWDLEQVEILRGPQSTQQGRNALAGAIYIRSKDPTFDKELKTRFDYASFDEYRGALAFNQPLIEDKLAFRLSVEQFGSDGFIDNEFRNENDFYKTDRQTVRGKLRYQPTTALDMVLGYTFSDNRSDIPFSDSTPSTDFETFRNINEFREGETHSANFRISYEINNKWSFTSESAYLEYDWKNFIDGDFLIANQNMGLQMHEDESFMQEIRLKYQGPGLNGTLGAYYADVSIEDTSDLTLNGALLGFPDANLVLSSANNADLENYAVFGEIDYEFSNWIFTIGARYDYEKRDDFAFQFIELDPPSFSFPNDAPADTDTSYSAFLPKVGLTYFWNEDVSTGFTVQRGYRAGGSSANSFEAFEFDEEETTNYELSLRSVWMNQRLVANANIFYTDWKDQQVRIDGPNPGPTDLVVENAGESELYGFELETQYFVNDNVDVFLNLGYVKTEFKEFVSNNEDLSGNEFLSSPQWTGSMGGSYYFDNGITAKLSGSYTDSVFDDAQNSRATKSDSHFIVDTQIGYAGDDWSALIFARNLFDKEYVTRDPVGGPTVQVGEPRVIGVQFNTNLF